MTSYYSDDDTLRNLRSNQFVKRKHQLENKSLMNFPITPIIDEQYDNVKLEDKEATELDIFSRDVTMALNGLTKEWASEVDLTSTDHQATPAFPISQYSSLPDHYTRTKPTIVSKKKAKISILSAFTQKRNQLR